jgi:hypothetical protein
MPAKITLDDALARLLEWPDLRDAIIDGITDRHDMDATFGDYADGVIDLFRAELKSKLEAKARAERMSK